MNNRALLCRGPLLAGLAMLPLSAAVMVGCGGYVGVDGYDAAYVESPPPNVEVYPRYTFADGYVYEVHGRYYHQHHGRWVSYRSAPRGMVRVEHR